MDPERVAVELRAIQSEHLEAVFRLKEYVEDCGAEAKSGSGTWGAFAKAFVGTAGLLGDRSVLMALKEGEEYGLRQYQEIEADRLFR